MEATFDVINEAKSIFNKEMEALVKTRDSLGEDFENLVELVLNCQGKVVLTGMGKPGHIATKISATLASLGTPSFFMHPGEAMHGDLGMVEKIGGKPEVKKHLENLGFVAGGNVTVISATGGNVIVNVKESRVAISKEMAQKIMI